MHSLKFLILHQVVAAEEVTRHRQAVALSHVDDSLVLRRRPRRVKSAADLESVECLNDSLPFGDGDRAGLINGIPKVAIRACEAVSPNRE